jgi:hypothetical protein
MLFVHDVSGRDFRPNVAQRAVYGDQNLDDRSGLMQLTTLSDDQLLDSLKTVCAQSRLLLARLLAHLAEVEERRLHLKAAYSSMYDFCMRGLGMSDGEACRRIAAARLARRFPDLLVRLERGEITLSTICLLEGELTETSYDDLVTASAGKSKREVQQLIAARSPKPDVADRIERLLPSAAPVPARVTPLSETRHEVRFTANDEVRKKLERAADLMRHANPKGDLAEIVERGLDLLIAKLEHDRLAKTSRPQRASRGTKAGTIAAATVRAVFERDGERCTYSGPDGCRCPATTLLEIDHIIPRAEGGTDDLPNLRVRCRAHNRLHAEQCFGRAHVDRRIDERQRQRGHESQTITTVASALVGMGFRDAEVRRALTTLKARSPDVETQPIVTVFREALAVLT